MNVDQKPGSNNRKISHNSNPTKDDRPLSGGVFSLVQHSTVLICRHHMAQATTVAGSSAKRAYWRRKR
eukprot:832863-Amphidinium_carterae.2